MLAHIQDEKAMPVVEKLAREAKFGEVREAATACLTRLRENCTPENLLVTDQTMHWWTAVSDSGMDDEVTLSRLKS